MLLDTAVVQRDVSALQKYAPLLESQARQLDHDLYLGIAQRGWGVLHTLRGEFVEARGCLDQAIDIFGALGTRWQLGRTHFELGDLAVANSAKDEAKKQYGCALKLFEEMGALPDVDKTLSMLKSIDEHYLESLNRESQ